MTGFLDKFKAMMLGTEYEENNYEDGDYEDTRDYDAYDGEDVSARDTHSADIDHIKTKKSSKNNNVLTFRNPNSATELQVVITYPSDVEDAAFICDHVKDNKACVVNLEGVAREKAQRIADFLGGASFALNGDIQRISNDIFMIAPVSVHISGDLKEELEAGSHKFSWASSFK